MIEINNINFNYGKHNVFQNVNLHLEPGRIYGLLGQNGVGKSTLLKILSGLLKIKGGECKVNGLVPYERTPAFLEDIYYLSEDFTGSDIEIEKYGMQVGAFYPNFDAKKFKHLLSEFDVDGKKKFTKVSFGQQKKGIIALALSLNTKILLMDEPSNGLDIPSKIHLRRLISENAIDDQLIIISTHQVRDLENLIDPIIILDKEGVLLEESILSISSKLEFSIEANKQDDALYSQAAYNGFSTVRLNTTGNETQVDLEALFNCTLCNKSLIKDIFKK